jgi:hypothetical protein
MPLLNYTTKIDIFTTLGQIQGMLVKHGARQIMQDYDDEGRVAAVSFTIPTPIGIQAIRLPANVEAVQKVLLKQKVKCDYEQAERVAWRIVKDWVEAQMAILESEMVTMDEIFLPYMLNREGETVYKLFTNNALLLNEGKSE